MGELAWNAETVALNYVMTRFRTCRHPNTVRWENTIWFENMEKIGSSLFPFLGFCSFNKCALGILEYCKLSNHFFHETFFQQLVLFKPKLNNSRYLVQT